MDDKKLYSWFLGPKAENADFLERLVLEALRDCVFWRRNFHPEDDIIITERVKRDDSFQDSHAIIQQEFMSMLANLKRDVPFYSPRYIGHMLGEQLLPAMAAYFAAMLHNPNNVSLEASPITTQYELEVATQLAHLMGYTGETWGHITSGGTIANFEALWVARNLKFFPIAVKEAAQALNVTSLVVTLPTGKRANLAELQDDWTLINLDPDEALCLRERLCQAYAAANPELPFAQAERRVDQELARHTISGKGLQRFFADWNVTNDNALDSGVLMVPATSHYSMQKIVEALGLGRHQLEMLPVDGKFRTDVDALRERLFRCIAERRPVIAVVSVLGTTEEGAVDLFDKVAELRDEMRRHGLTFYHHCDAAWGGYVRTLFVGQDGQSVKTPTTIRKLTQTWPSDEIFESYSAIHRTDSITIDPHKLGYIPYPCGTIVFRNTNVKDLVSTEAPYIFHGEEHRERPFIGKHILEGSKPGAAAAACWFAHRVVPLNQDGYGLLIGKSIQSTQELAYCVDRELAPELAKRGILLRMLTAPPDGNILCFAVNRAGNQCLVEMNRINQAIYDALKFHPESVIQHHNFIISSTSLNYEQYGLKGGQGKHSLTDHLAALGIPDAQFAEVGSVKILRCTVMNPWLALSRGGKPDYSALFAEVLRQTIAQSINGAT